MKNTSPFGLLGVAAMSASLAFSSAWADSMQETQAVSATEQQAQAQEGVVVKSVHKFDISYVRNDGFEQVRSRDINSWFDESWYQPERFPNMNADSIFFPDAYMTPLERAVLLFDHLEGELPHARYRVQMGTDFSAMSETDQGPLAFIEVTRFNLGPALHDELSTQYDQVADLEEFGVGPHVARRFIFTPIQGMNAHILAAGRKELTQELAAEMQCLGQSCLVLEEIKGKSGDWEQIPVPDWVTQSSLMDDAAGDTGRVLNDTVAEAVHELAIAHLGSEYGEPVESVQAPEPYLEIVVSKDITGQVPVLDVISHQGHLMDDALSDIWYRRIQIEGSVPQWERLVQHRRPMGH